MLTSPSSAQDSFITSPLSFSFTCSFVLLFRLIFPQMPVITEHAGLALPEFLAGVPQPLPLWGFKEEVDLGNLPGSD